MLGCNRDGYLAVMEHKAGIERVTGHGLGSGCGCGSGCGVNLGINNQSQGETGPPRDICGWFRP